MSCQTPSASICQNSGSNSGIFWGAGDGDGAGITSGVPEYVPDSEEFQHLEECRSSCSGSCEAFFKSHHSHFLYTPLNADKSQLSNGILHIRSEKSMSHIAG